MRLLRSAHDRIERLRVRLYLCWLRRQPGVVVGEVEVEGIPLIDVRNGGRVIIEDHVRLCSRNSGYHLNLFAPVKLFADRPGAVVKIGAHSRVYGTCIHAFASIEIGRNCLIAGNCQIMDASGHELCFADVDERAGSKDAGRPIVIEDSVWLGTGTIVMPGVRIGRGSVVGAGSVVTRDIPPLCLAAGNPARVIRCYESTPGTEAAKDEGT
jgi:acetyltransferase-like isoleucine patch superfamily enzyme